MTSRSSHRGFTLIEVLLATFVIALGVLGLLALFAGAAKQQQTSSQETAAVFAARSAQGGLSQGFGALRSSPPPEEGCPAGSSPFPVGVWQRLVMDMDKHFLSIPTDGSICGPYFLVDGRSALLFRAPADAGTISFPGVNDPSVFTGMPTGIFAASTFELPDRRIDLTSLKIQVEVTQLRDDDGDGAFERVPADAPNGVLVFERRPGVRYSSDSLPNRVVYTLGGDPAQDPMWPFSIGPETANYMIVDPQLIPGESVPARVVDLQVALVGGPLSPIPDTSARVETVSVASYKWRNDQLVSLDDRLHTRADPGAPNGRSADQCYSVLFRRTGTGSQAMVMSYQLTATSASSEFVPPETARDNAQNRTPIRQIGMYLHVDVDDNQQFYFRVTDEKDLWAITPGQVLLIAGDEMLGQIGSDRAVKVVRQTRETNGTAWRGYVDRMPRLLDRPAVPAGEVSAGPLQVFGIADTVVSRSGGSTWKLTPLIASDFSVRLGN